MTRDPLLELRSARMVANLAHDDGVAVDHVSSPRPCGHIGAILADSILQAGLNYTSVVRPRVDRIRALYPHAATTEALMSIVSTGQVGEFLVWSHPVKISRFEGLVVAMNSMEVRDARELRTALGDEEFCLALQQINGVGPKTVDYMACLAGIESVAVDRHIRSYAAKAGVEGDEYQFLKRVFCFAADLLSVSRRGFDAWVWRRESKQSAQMRLAI